MKKVALLLVFNILFFFSYSQYSISFGLPNVNISSVKKGDDIFIPIKIIKRSPSGPTIGSYCIGFDLFFEYDHDLLEWKGFTDNPLPGVQNFSPLCEYSSRDWIFNDNGIVLVCLWQDPVFSGEKFEDGTILFEYIFTYKGGINSGESSPLIWTREQVVVDGKVQKGKTDAFTDNLKPYDEVILVNGSIYKD